MQANSLRVPSQGGGEEDAEMNGAAEEEKARRLKSNHFMQSDDESDAEKGAGGGHCGEKRPRMDPGDDHDYSNPASRWALRSSLSAEVHRDEESTYLVEVHETPLSPFHGHGHEKAKMSLHCSIPAMLGHSISGDSYYKPSIFNYDVHTISFRECLHLDVLPSGIGECCGLTELDFGACQSLKCLPPTLSRLEHLRILCMQGCSKLRELPAAIGYGKNLKDLDLEGCRALISLPAELGSVSGLTKLDVRGCSSIQSLPDTVFGSSLRDLSLQHCKKLKKLPLFPLGAILRKLDLEGCSQLRYLPEEISRLKELEEIDLTDCRRLRELPETLAEIPHLRVLSLCGCSSLQSMPTWMSDRSTLERVDFYLSDLCKESALLSDSASVKIMEDLPIEICLQQACGKVREDLPIEICKDWQESTMYFRGRLHSHPYTLDLREWRTGASLTIPDFSSLRLRVDRVELPSLFRLLCVPPFVAGMKAKTIIDGGGSLAFKIPEAARRQIQVLPRNLEMLNAVTQLDLSGCDALNEVPDTISQLVKLRSLNLGGCTALSCLPETLSQLTDLRTLLLDGCIELSTLPNSTVKVQKLEVLSLDGCSALQSLPWALALKEDLDLRVSGCPLRDVPSFIMASGGRAVLQYLKDLSAGASPCNMVKIVLVGEQRAGKSSLLDSLLSEENPPRSADDRTVGIDVWRWRVAPGMHLLDLDSEKVETVEEEEELWLRRRESDWEEEGEEWEEEDSQTQSQHLLASLYDAAGHRIYRASHSLFMSADALYVNVVSAAGETEDILQQLWLWVELVQQQVPGAKMAVVFTHLDLDLGRRHVPEKVMKMVSAILDENNAILDKSLRLQGSSEEKIEQELAEILAHRLDAWKTARLERDQALDALDRWAKSGCRYETCALVVEELEKSGELDLQYGGNCCDNCEISALPAFRYDDELFASSSDEEEDGDDDDDALRSACGAEEEKAEAEEAAILGGGSLLSSGGGEEENVEEEDTEKKEQKEDHQLWVQCDLCDKWRKDNAEYGRAPEFHCTMIPGAACSDVQELNDDEKEQADKEEEEEERFRLMMMRRKKRARTEKRRRKKRARREKRRSAIGKKCIKGIEGDFGIGFELRCCICRHASPCETCSLRQPFKTAVKKLTEHCCDCGKFLPGAAVPGRHRTLARCTDCAEAASGALTTRLHSLHETMARIEEEVRTKVNTFEFADQFGSDLPSSDELNRLRKARLNQPKLLFCRGTSCVTKQGMASLKCRLSGVLHSKELFPMVGQDQPLTHTLVGELIRAGQIKLWGRAGDLFQRLGSKDLEVRRKSRQRGGISRFSVLHGRVCEALRACRPPGAACGAMDESRRVSASSAFSA